MTLSEELRSLADRLEVQNRAPVAPDIGIGEAVRRLRESWKRGELIIEINWSDYNDVAEIDFKFLDKATYKTAGEEKSLAVLVEKMLVINRPNDTLDRLDSMLPAKEPEKEKVGA